ncbi:DUF2093 domain-containing protein [Sandarakinorhabdus sp.]|uniref:DUF2093 domain-containing protein n=1 Tax=Sandarakinorhabdus sp. TaxID=1916663 RepID=UPI00286E44EB|nr:DUF2093 domain-containing protein [Sandarakinorhabdus sp.]
MLDTLGRPARLRYLSGSYQIVSPGDYVVCAVTGKRITLTALRYWSSEFQEAYFDAATATARYADMRSAGRI